MVKNGVGEDGQLGIGLGWRYVLGVYSSGINHLRTQR